MDTPGKQENRSGVEDKRILHFFWRNLPRVVLLVAFLLIILLGLAIGEKKDRLEQEKKAAQARKPRAVNIVALELRPATIKDAINLPGVIEPWVKLEVLAKVSGSIEEILVQEGSIVQKGDVLARIEAEDYRIALDSSRAAYELASADYERARIMVEKNAVPKAELDNMKTRMLTARAAMEDAQLKLSRTEIIAPLNGVVSRLDAEIGLFLSVGDPIGQLLQIDPVKAVVGIPESDVNAVRSINRVDMTIKALDGRTVTGSKYFLAPAPDSVARLYSLELEVDNPERTILPGMFVRADIVKQTISGAISVPLYSVISRNDEQFVFIEENGIAHKRMVELGIIEGWQVQIVRGLQAGDRVIVEGHRDVEDGQEVEVIKVIADPGAMQL